MGIPLLSNRCSTNRSASAPDPSRYELADYWIRRNSYVLKVRYLDATNFEGMKIMVYKGEIPARLPARLDPHFSGEPSSPIARFRPDAEGLSLALKLAESL